METEIKVRIAAIEGIEDFHPVPSSHCNYCPMTLQCPKIEELNKIKTMYGNVKAGPIVTAQEAKTIAEVLTVIDLGYDVLNSRLKQFVKEIGPVQILGKEYSNSISEKYEVLDDKKQELWDFLEKSGHDPMKFVDFDVKQIQNLWKSGAKGSFFDEVKKFLRITKSTRFGGRKL
jgi:DNA-binding NarL/FixJ family response regulator